MQQTPNLQRNPIGRAKDRNFLILDETSKILPSKLAEALFARIMGESNESA
jgi:hypothetical protein